MQHRANVGSTTAEACVQTYQVRRAGAVAAALALIPCSRLPAQERAPIDPWFPDHHFFTPLLADPREVHLGVALVSTNLFAPGNNGPERPPLRFKDAEDLDNDVQGAVALGGTVTLWQPAAWPDGGLTIGAQAGVFARFRIEEPSRDYAISDWLVALPIEVADGPLSARLRILHRSSHLGDELLLDARTYRIEFGHEAVDLLVAHRILGSGRIYGGGSFIFRSNTESEPLLRLRGLDIHDNFAIQAGADGSWYRWAGDRIGVMAGLDWQRAQRTGWRDQFSAAAGVAAHGAGGGLRLLFRFFTGVSPVGEFFLTDERYYALELAVWR
ncbi:MAG TPA: DUF1207 domain-containing protein [Longimicrobiales bacterium]